MTWHASKDNQNGLIRHPKDSKAW